MFTLEPPPCCLFHDYTGTTITTFAPFRRRFALHRDSGFAIPCPTRSFSFLQIRFLGAASFIFTALPGCRWSPAGHLIHLGSHSSPALRAPSHNSILVPHSCRRAARSCLRRRRAPIFAVLKHAVQYSTVCLFGNVRIPLSAAKARFGCASRPGRVVCVVGFCATLFYLRHRVYLFRRPQSLHFAIKITHHLLTNLIGSAFYFASADYRRLTQYMNTCQRVSCPIDQAASFVAVMPCRCPDAEVVEIVRAWPELSRPTLTEVVARLFSSDLNYMAIIACRSRQLESSQSCLRVRMQLGPASPGTAEPIIV